MKIDVSRHRNWIEAAVASGDFSSAEEAVDAALVSLEHDREFSAESITELGTGALRAEINLGLSSGPAEPWTGAQDFIAEMRRAGKD